MRNMRGQYERKRLEHIILMLLGPKPLWRKRPSAQLQVLSKYNRFSLEVELISLLNMMWNVYICNNSVSET